MKAVSALSVCLSIRVLCLCVLVLPLAVAAQGAGKAAQWKPIWEPVNYPGDFRLNSVYFVNANVGWISAAGQYGGKGGVLLYTENGGEKWDVQLGDPNSEEAEFQQLFFLDARNGWAQQNGGKLLRTTDGKTWQEAGSFPRFQMFTYFAFTSPQRGFVLAGSPNESKIFSTQDGGRNWKQDFPCVAQVQIEGLTRRASCSFFDLHFPTTSVGYAVGGPYNGGFAIVAKTEDGGANWRAVFASTDIDTISTVSFTDEKRGVIRTRDYKIFVTEDGGQSWRGIAASARGAVRFADPSVGWSCWARGCAVSADGGNSWTSRDFSLPTTVKSFSAPRRDRVFLIGDHGMVYRYRVVPADHTAKGIAAAPPVPGYGAELNVQIAGIQDNLRELQTRASSAQGETLLKEASFTEALAKLESGAGALSQQAPAFAQRHRNLNLLFVGSNMRDDLQGKTQGIREAVLAVKSASDLKTFTGALQDLDAKLQDTATAISTGFQHLASAEGAAAPGAVRNMAVQGTPEKPAAASQPAAGTQPGGSGSGTAVDGAVNALKRFIRF